MQKHLVSYINKLSSTATKNPDNSFSRVIPDIKIMSNKSIINERYIKNKNKIEPKICHSSSSSEAQSIHNMDEEEHFYGKDEIDFQNECEVGNRKHHKFNSQDIDTTDLKSDNEEAYSKTQRLNYKSKIKVQKHQQKQSTLLQKKIKPKTKPQENKLDHTKI